VVRVEFTAERPGTLRWSRLAGQFGGLAQVDRVGDYAASFSSMAAA
jgi:hypothetical protein